MEDALSPTDISSSLSEFVRKERILKELYQENSVCPKSLELKPLQYNDEEIDGILQQMGRLLSPAGQESDNLIYKHVIEETENKSIEQILSEAKELINDSAPVAESVSIYNSTDHSSSENSEDSIRFVNIENTNNHKDEIHSNDIELQSKLEKLNHPTKKSKNVLMPIKNQCSNVKKESLNSQKVEVKYAQNNEKIESLREEVVRVTQLYDACKQQCSKLKKEMFRLEEDLMRGTKWASNTTSVDLFVKKDKLKEVKQSLFNASMDFRVLLEDVQRAIDEENPPLTSDELNEFTSRKGHRMTFEQYHRAADIFGFVDYLASARSNFVSVHTLGQSVEGRPIKMIKISSGKPNATAFWIDGGIHAREWISVASVSYIINELVENRDNLEKEVQDIDFYIVPLLNPDGYEYSHESERLWRKNRRRSFGAFCVGTDLNRNWAHEWGGQGSSKFPCQEIYAGSGPLSEPETKAVADFLMENASKFRGFVTFHSYGQYILYPWGYSKRVPADVDDLDRVGRIAAASMKQSGGTSYTVGNSAALLYAASGGSDDWAKGIAKIKYAYTIELRDNGRYGFILPASHIKPTGKEAYAAIKAIAKELKTGDENDVVVDTIVKFPDNNIIFRFDQFPRIEDIFQFMSFLASNFSDHVQVFDIGYTEENLPLRILRIASPSRINSTVWIDGGIHAREWISITSVCFIMYILAVKWFSLNMAVQNTEFFIMPVVNPDGYRYSYTKDRLWRKNRRYNGKCYGVDLNRNFPYKWGTEHVLINNGPRAQKNVCNEIYEGPTAVSEAESLAITEFIESSKGKFQAFLTFHSFGPRINYPYGYEPRVPKDAPLLNFVAQKAKNLIINMTKVKYDVLPLSMTEYVSPGNSIDWAYKMNITFSYLIELSNNSFITPTSEIVPTGKEAMIILMTVIDHLHMDQDEIATISPPNDLFEEQQWKEREKQIIEENRQLKQNISSAVSQQEFENFGKKLNNANEMINHLKSNLKKATEEWNKKEMKLIDECNQLRCKLKNSPKILQPDIENLQEQLKDTQEVNVKLKLDLDSYKDKCRTLETLCADLKKVIVDEQIAEKVYANDNIPASVKQFLSSSSSSVFNTLSHMFGCLSRSASRNRNYSYSGQKGDLFTTTGSSMINDLTKSCEQNDLMKELLKEKEHLRKENQDLNRQVKELEIIVRRRTHPNFSNVSEIIRSEESRIYEKESEMIKNLKKELLEKQQIILDLKNQIVDSKARYDKNLLTLQSKILSIQEESIKLKEELEKKKNTPTNYIAKNKRKGRSCDPPSHTTRNFRIELAAKEREVQLLNKQLEELKKNNRKLMKEREDHSLSSKEQSADIIHLKNNNYDAVVTESEEYDRYKYSTSDQPVDTEGNNVVDMQIQKQNIENDNFESSDDVVHNCVNNSHKFKNKVSSGQDYSVQTNLNISNNNDCLSEKLTSSEVNHQNLVQITCDLLKLLTKTEFAANIRNSNYSSGQYDELNRFVTALKSVAD